MANIEEIARRAKVSKTTVSFVINSKPGISEQTAAHVRRVMDEMDYVPSALAQRFASQRSMAVALITLPYPHVFRDPHHTEALDGVYQALEHAGYSLILGASNERFVTERKFDRMLRSGQVDGLLLLEPTLDQPYLRDLAAENRPVVIVNGDGASLGLDSVRTDDLAVGAMAADHLCDLGHTRIGMIMGSPNHASARDRLAGFRASLERHGIQLDERRTFQGYYESSEESGREGIRKILTDQPDTTAIFCCNDTMAQWALQGAVEMERPVPDSISLIGVDDHPISAYSRPALASVRQPSRDIARVATEILLQRLAEAGDNGSRETMNRLLPPTLIPRESCTPPL